MGGKRSEGARGAGRRTPTPAPPHKGEGERIASTFLHPTIRALFPAMARIPALNVSHGPFETQYSRPLRLRLSDTLNFLNFVTLRSSGPESFSSLGKLKLMKLPFSFGGLGAA